MYRSYCSEKGCPGHLKSWENCRELRAFASAAVPGARLGETREAFARRIASQRAARAETAPYGKLK